MLATVADRWSRCLGDGSLHCTKAIPCPGPWCGADSSSNKMSISSGEVGMQWVLRFFPVTWATCLPFDVLMHGSSSPDSSAVILLAFQEENVVFSLHLQDVVAWSYLNSTEFACKSSLSSFLAFILIDAESLDSSITEACFFFA